MTKQIGIVCHDAGGAEIISHWVKQNKINPILHLEGPAIKIFKRVLSKLNLVSLEELIENSNLLMLGTSWQSDLEKKSFIVARKKINLKIIVVFDHWVDFEKRLIYKNNFLKPDQIWVTDQHAKEIAERIFNNIKIIKINNYYLEEMKFKYENLKSEASLEKTILYISDNSSEYQKNLPANEKWNYDELSCLKYLLKNLNSIENEKTKLIIRPHPSEDSKKFFNIIAEFSHIDIRLSNNEELIYDLVNCKTVVGTDSMACYIASFFGIKVISIIPKGGKEMTIPSNNIHKIVY